MGGVVEALALDDLRQQLEVNVTGQVAITQAMLPAVRSARGRIVFMSSESGRVAWPALTPYAASKFAVEAVADGLRIELRPWGVDVVLIEPGAFDTDMWRRSGPHLERIVAAMTEQQREDYAELVSGSRKLMRLTARRAAPVEKVVKVIERALTAGKPKTRYVVGPDARAQIALRSLLPNRVFDAVLARAFGLR